MKTKGIIFDLDGTLLNTIDDITDAVNTVLIRYGYPAKKAEDYKKIVGEGIRSLVKKAIRLNFQKGHFSKTGQGGPYRFTDEQIPTLIEEMRTEYWRRLKNKTTVYDGVADMLDRLTARKIKLAILSNKPQDMTTEVVGHYFRKWNFAAILGASDETPRKPKTVGILKIVEMMKLAKRAVIMVGDSKIDIKTARNAGMKGIGVTWGFKSRKELIASGASEIIDKPKELIGLLE